MKFRTQLAAAAAVTMLVGLAACGDDDDSDTASPGTSTTDTSPSGTLGEPSATPSHAAGHSDGSAMITMKDNTFSPASLEVAPGAEIMVMNEGAAVHNLKDTDSKGKAFDSGDVAGGKDTTITAPDKTGNYPYECTLHFGMTGTLKVK